MTLVLAADAPLGSARVSAAGVARTAGEAVTVIVEAAHAALPDAHIPAAGRIDAACEIDSIRVGASLTEFIFAFGVC